jgi:hypothetical protein
MEEVKFPWGANVTVFHADYYQIVTILGKRPFGT